MKKNTQKQLRLNKVTLRLLSDDQTRLVAGGRIRSPILQDWSNDRC